MFWQQRLDVTLKVFAPSSILEAATGGILRKKVFLEISQNAQENTCGRVCFLIKLRLRTPFLQNTSGWLLLVFSVRSFVTRFRLPSSLSSESDSLSSVSVITYFSGSNRYRFKDLNLLANSTKISLSVSKELYRNFHQTILLSQVF